MKEMQAPTPMTSYKPSAWYQRNALRKAKTLAEAQKIGQAVIDEHERLKAWMRDEMGMIPPKFKVLKDEAIDKGW